MRKLDFALENLNFQDENLICAYLFYFNQFYLFRIGNDIDWSVLLRK